MDSNVAQFILSEIADRFCNLMHDEDEGVHLHMPQEVNDLIAWKRPIEGVRKMAEKQQVLSTKAGHDNWEWVHCKDSQPHEQNLLILCQLILTESRQKVAEDLHNVVKSFGIPHNCTCMKGLKQVPGKDHFDLIIGHLEQGNHQKPQNPVPAPIQNEDPNRLPKQATDNAPHTWLCDGWLLRLWDPNYNGNYKLFQNQWKCGQPVLVCNMTNLMDMELWNPQSFKMQFGGERGDVINCANGETLPNFPMKQFWEGFQSSAHREKDKNGNDIILKLKDWPPGEDFSLCLPERFMDFMQAVPLSHYVAASGCLNLVAYLPQCHVRPDLGPKLYVAYGSASSPTTGTTNLHLDISDAVNCMVYVGVTAGTNNDEHKLGKKLFSSVPFLCNVFCETALQFFLLSLIALDAIREAGCDDKTIRRVTTEKAIPGALWHIYHARDTNKIRDLLNQVAVERGMSVEPHHDPIHDQTWYLDIVLRDRLLKEYDVKGYAILQCLGDAVFIPAGAAHQVWNLNNCIKVAKDFVSPENVPQCFHLTHEFMKLSDNHTNHEDKLQIKNIIYHTVKHALSSLQAVQVHDSDSSDEEVEIFKGGRCPISCPAPGCLKHPNHRSASLNNCSHPQSIHTGSRYSTLIQGTGLENISKLQVEQLNSRGIPKPPMGQLLMQRLGKPSGYK
ncbi:hypothetical protein ONE63_009590 [Megalurothrips usitatus]|uniref:JmjC domain-containing protein n=1 Tax=Megalurothrips usitatus TaxID=439358 RepID=A0AAV7XNF7_9NEOP|nr:hypothetical protein ONE63_009590 [Megalurothrips usitatus]